MKALVIAIATFLLSSVVKSQTFDGVYIGGDITNTVSRYKAKGYVYQTTFANIVHMRGFVANEYCDLYIVFTPKTKITCKVVVEFAEIKSYYSLKSEYLKYKAVFKDKYGAPDNEYFFFKAPYEEGDGYELTAVATDNVRMSSYWFERGNTTLAVEVSKDKKVKLSYENDMNMALKRNEEEAINRSSF